MEVAVSVCFCGGPQLGSGPAEVSNLSLLPRQSLPCTCSSGGRWLRPAFLEVIDTGLVLCRSLARACSLCGHSLVPAPFPSEPKYLQAHLEIDEIRKCYLYGLIII